MLPDPAEPRRAARAHVYRDHHATIFVPAAAAGDVEAARRQWDPVMAARIAAHLTVVYPEEAPALGLLVERLRDASGAHAPFRLRLGGLACFERPERGVYVCVHDVEDGYRRLREDVLREPFRPVAFPPHVTLVHPRTSARGRELWDRARPQWQEQEFIVTQLTITGFDGARWGVLDRFDLGQGGSPRPVAAADRI